MSMPHNGESHITIHGIYKRFFLPLVALQRRQKTQGMFRYIRNSGFKPQMYICIYVYKV
jgi:hypothetical protein